jgi:hypothetical protein
MLNKKSIYAISIDIICRKTSRLKIKRNNTPAKNEAAARRGLRR